MGHENPDAAHTSNKDNDESHPPALTFTLTLEQDDALPLFAGGREKRQGCYNCYSNSHPECLF
jgi:predicted Zn-dependent peptidase